LRWVILSIVKDKMTPTEKLILNRVKECFGLKISQKQWESIIWCIHNRVFTNTHFRPEVLPSKDRKIPEKIEDQLLFGSYFDSVSGSNFLVLKLKNEPCVLEDQGTIDFKNDKLW